MQFYENMRFPDSQVSYRIEDCPLNQKDQMERAFNIIENKTILNFYSVNSNEEISVTCDSAAKTEGRMFIAGEGGPTQIVKTEKFSIILKGEILLIKESRCEQPNVAIHELLHVLGFDHSENPNNIMYNISRCDQEIGEDTIGLINWLYEFPSLPDLSFEQASASMKGRYLDVSVTIRNNGLKDAEASNLIIYSGDKKIKEFEIEALEIGFGRSVTLTNILVISKIEDLRIFIDYPYAELDKQNNEIFLEVIENN
ncbi:matrixin family metalloprotease [Candidatus Pacearchaeota archaeon]|nr:matrixin family metalloprotease [Candidatus Pacearchaeota archaeon]